jgi:hypothetical protein
VVWGVFVRVTTGTTMHWFLTRFCHTRGPQSWLVEGANVQAHDLPMLAIPTMGEAWHKTITRFRARRGTASTPDSAIPGTASSSCSNFSALPGT